MIWIKWVTTMKSIILLHLCKNLVMIVVPDVLRVETLTLILFKERNIFQDKTMAMIAHSIDSKFDENSGRLARGLSSQHSNGLAARARTGSWMGCVLPMAQHHSSQVKCLMLKRGPVHFSYIEVASWNEWIFRSYFLRVAGCDIWWLLG